MPITRLPLANLENYGARLIDNGPSGFRVEPASGNAFGVFAWPPESMHIETHLSTVSAPKPTYVGQKMIEAYCEFDATALAVSRNHRLSDVGKAEQLQPSRVKAAKAASFALNDLAKFEREVAQQEVQRYAVPGLNPTDLVGALRDHEIRTAVRGMSDDERTALMRSLNAGDDRTLLEAILRSPLKTGRLEGMAINGWRALRDNEDPDGRALLDLAAEHTNWARRVAGAVKGMLLPKLGFKPLELFDVVKEFGAAEFFDGQTIFNFERMPRARAA